MAEDMCSIVDRDGKPCPRRRSKRGWCEAHYQRWLKYDDPLAGGTFHGAPRAWLHAAIERSALTEECITDWPFYRDPNGYPRLNATGSAGMAYHPLMEMTGRPRPAPPGDKVRHLCGNGHLACLHSGHIVWGTMAENAADKVRHGTTNLGKRVPTGRKLTADDVLAIRASDESSEVLARRFDVTAVNIRMVRRGKTWRHLLPQAE